MTNFSDMLSKAKVMQEKMKEAQDQIKKIEVEGEAGGKLVKVILSGDYELKSIIIIDCETFLITSTYLKDCSFGRARITISILFRLISSIVSSEYFRSLFLVYFKTLSPAELEE